MTETKTLAIFGATGGVGRQLTRQALDAGHRVVAYVRDPSKLPEHERLTSVQGELDDAAAIARAVAGADAVLSALGPRQNTPDQVEVFGTAMQNLLDAMKAHGVKRLVSISGAGVILPGDAVTLGRRLVRALLLLLAKHVARTKEREAELIRATDLEWVLVRPPRVVPGERTGDYRAFPDRVPSPKITQGDVADLMLKCVTSDEWVRKAPIPGV